MGSTLPFAVEESIMTLAFGRRLRIARLRVAMSSQALADASGITLAVIQNIESGRKKSITVDEIAAFSGALGITPGDLDERLAHPETVARRADLKTLLATEIVRLKAELEALL